MSYGGRVTNRIELPWEGDGRSVAARIAGQTARRIAEGSLPAGELLTEAMLARGERASRTPAREAMLQLQAWGLVRLMPKKGAIVTAVSARQRRDLLDVRTTWEIRSVQVVADRPVSRRALADELHALIRSQQGALDEGDRLGFAAHDFAFHRRIIEAGQNEVVDALMSQLGPRFARLTHMAVAAAPGAAALFRDEHEGLAELIAAGDAAGFAASVRSHVSSAHLLVSDW